jgi:hypothetical protein
MTRDLTAGMQAEVVKTVLQPRFFFEAQFDSGTLRLWTGIGPITWNGEEWTGAGGLVGISELTESQDLKAVGFTVTLSGISSSIISIALAEDYQGRACNVWVGAMNDAGQIIADPHKINGGRMDVMEIDEAGETCAVAVHVEGRLIDLERPREHRYEHEDQLALYPGDLFFQYGPSIQEKPIIWGRS